MLMRFDPFREFDRLVGAADAAARAPRSFPMDAFRRGDQFVVRFDLPGVDPKSVDLSVDRNVLTVLAERRSDQQQGDQVVVFERPEGAFTRQLMLGDQLDSENIQANYVNGVLELTIPVAEQPQPRRIEVTGGDQPQQIGGGSGHQTDAGDHEIQGGGGQSS
jgi:HSP20 family protein